MSFYIIIILILIMPGIFFFAERLFAKNRQRKRLNLAMTYDMMVLKHKLSIDYLDILKNKIIALDRSNDMLVLIDQSRGIEQELCLSLSEVETVRIIRERREEDNSIRKIFLQFTLIGNMEHHRFCFYDGKKDSIMEFTRLSRMALLWKDRVNNHIHQALQLRA